MAEIIEVLYQKTKQVTNTKIADTLGISRTSVRKYIKMAESFGFNLLVSSTKLEEITIKVEDKLYNSNKELAWYRNYSGIWDEIIRDKL